MLHRPCFTSHQHYGQTFTNGDVWRPYVQHVWGSHGLGEVRSVRPGLPGTNPVFVVNETLVVKFFTDLFGFDADQVELAFYQSIAPQLDVPVPQLLAFGDLFERDAEAGWHYPYLVMTKRPGISFGEWTTSTPCNLVDATGFAATVLKSLHSCTLPVDGPLAAGWSSFHHVLSHRRRAIRPSIEALPITDELRVELLERLERMDIPNLTQGVQPCLLHGDLNPDHLLCEPSAGGSVQWTGVIDFGDVKVGDPLYDLVPLHIGLHRSDPSLLQSFISTYRIAGWDSAVFSERAMNYTILYESDVLTECFAAHNDWRNLTRLVDLQDRLWGLSQKLDE